MTVVWRVVGPSWYSSSAQNVFVTVLLLASGSVELVGLYWQIGRLILDRQESQGWGSKVIGRLAADLRAEFPGMRGLSQRSLVYMRTFAAAFEAPLRSLLRNCRGGTSWCCWTR